MSDISIHKMPNKCIQFVFPLVFAPTCFSTYIPPSRSLYVPSKLPEHLHLLWVKSERLLEVDHCLLPRCVAIATHLGILVTIKLHTNFHARTSLLDTYSERKRD